MATIPTSGPPNTKASAAAGAAICGAAGLDGSSANGPGRRLALGIMPPPPDSWPAPLPDLRSWVLLDAGEGMLMVSGPPAARPLLVRQRKHAAPPELSG